MQVPAHQLFHLGPGYWAPIPHEVRHSHLLKYMERAEDLLASLGYCLPEDGRLAVIVQAAMETCLLFFMAAMHEPTAEELDEVFDHFVLKTVAAAESGSESGA